MEHTIIRMAHKKKIALVAHDNMKKNLLEWAKWNRELLVAHDLYATDTTGKLLEEVLQTNITKLQSGPLGGDQQIGARIKELLCSDATPMNLTGSRTCAPQAGPVRGRWRSLQPSC